MQMENKHLELHKKMKFSIKYFFSKCNQLLRQSLMQNFIFCAV